MDMTVDPIRLLPQVNNNNCSQLIGLIYTNLIITEYPQTVMTKILLSIHGGIPKGSVPGSILLLDHTYYSLVRP